MPGALNPIAGCANFKEFSQRLQIEFAQLERLNEISIESGKSIFSITDRCFYCTL